MNIATLCLFIMDYHFVLAAPLYTTESLENLVDGFRRQQIVMSSTMLNVSHNLGLAEKLATAESEEAEERAVNAFRKKEEAKTPFIATTSRLGLGYIGRGYDIYQGNPISEDGVVDQGFRLPIIDLPFTYKFTSDGEYRVPDNVDVISETSASFGSTFHQVKTETDFESMLQVDVSVHARAKGWGFKASFKASTSYKKAVREIRKGETTKLDLVGRAIVYKARLSPTPTLSKLSTFFEEAISTLPSEDCESGPIQALYTQVIQRFGTHYTTEVVMGAKAVQELRFRNSDLDRLQSQGVSVQTAAQISYGSLGFSGTAGFSVGVSSSSSFRQMVSDTQKEHREYYIGGSPPTGDYSTGSTESLREWARSAAENPAPIQYQLASIDELLRPEYFKRKINDLYQRRKCLRRALFSYCTNSVTASYCTVIPDSDTDEEGQTLRFGDFVNVRNENTFLALSQSYGVVPGSTVRPLTSVSKITNYDGLFQLVPPEEINNKLGANIHYGEPFHLKTIEGDQLHTGRTIILNTDMPSEPRLLDLFQNKDEETSVNIKQSQVMDFSVFLKKEVSTYLVSLRVYCYHNDTVTFQVEMEGKLDTINGLVIISCLCNKAYKQYCKLDWFHSFVTEGDIGDITHFQVMGMYGTETNHIRGVQVQTIKSGEKKVVSWSGNCRGRVFRMAVHKSETRQIKIEIYPVQFTFHSTDPLNIEGQAVNVRDTGFIHVLSSIPKKTFWGHSITQLLSLESTGKIGIEELGPEEHTPFGSVCNTLIFPSTTQLSHRHDFVDRIVISFDITVKINYVEIETKENINYTVSKINDDNEFVKISDFKFEQVNNTMNLSLNEAIYTTGIMIRPIVALADSNITEIVQMVAVGGCLSALVNSRGENTSKLQWKMELSENRIRTFPYLKVIPKSSDTVDIEMLFKRSEVPVTGNFTTTMTLSSGQLNCVFTNAYLIDRLTQSGDTAELKFESIKLTQDSTHKIIITMQVTAISREEYNKGFLLLNKTVHEAGQDFTCQSGSLQQTSSLSSADQSDSTLSMPGVIVGFIIVGVLLLAVLGFMIYRVRKEKEKLRDLPGGKTNVRYQSSTENLSFEHNLENDNNQ